MKPEPRLIRSPDDAELVACEWLRYFGYTDADADPGAGPDGGVDIRGERVVAQVKAEMRSVGRPVIQQLFGIASLEERQAVVFALAGFSPDAEDWADEAGVALFQFDYSGEPTPVNPAAHGMVAEADGDADWTPPKSRKEREREAKFEEFRAEYEARLADVQAEIDRRGRIADEKARELRQADLDDASPSVFDLLVGRKTMESLNEESLSRRQARRKQVDDASARIDEAVQEYERLQNEFQSRMEALLE